MLRADAAALPPGQRLRRPVTCVTALHLPPDPTPVLREWARVLRPGGRAVTATFRIADRPAGSRGFPTFHTRTASPAALSRTVAPAGLRVTRHRTWDHDGGDSLLLAELEPVPRTA
ncbi:methyltransferase domain-containing protein [Isoptericola sp. AK164]|uniref:methyltransferase domain-containing protein n=1 Tax=Isoptericola sp. AK164 TaxID=3024246 RepID=UPI00241895DF|nr:methyltransferase domain-containing protein [Isoptericola sp. AK164]